MVNICRGTYTSFEQFLIYSLIGAHVQYILNPKLYTPLNRDPYTIVSYMEISNVARRSLKPSVLQSSTPNGIPPEPTAPVPETYLA